MSGYYRTRKVAWTLIHFFESEEIHTYSNRFIISMLTLRRNFRGALHRRTSLIRPRFPNSIRRPSTHHFHNGPLCCNLNPAQRELLESVDPNEHWKHAEKPSDKKLDVSAIAEFFDKIEEVQRRLFGPDLGGLKRSSSVWYRGHRDDPWQLSPTLLRENLKRKTSSHSSDPSLLREKDLLSQYLHVASKYVGHLQSDWETLAYMQHYGVPTNLLDWSSQLHTALYFAICDHHISQNDTLTPHIWVLNPYRLNSLTFHIPCLFDGGDRVGEPHTAYPKPSRPGQVQFGISKEKLPPLHKNRAPDTVESATVTYTSPWPYEKPIALTIGWKDSRIEHQQGVFTYHGYSLAPMEEQLEAYQQLHVAEKVKIKYHQIRPLRDLMYRLGFSHHRYWQNQESLAKDVLEEFEVCLRL